MRDVLQNSNAVQVDIGDLLPLAQAALQGASAAVLTPSLPELAVRLEQPPLAASSAAYYDSFVAGASPDACQPLCLPAHILLPAAAPGCMLVGPGAVARGFLKRALHAAEVKADWSVQWPCAMHSAQAPAITHALDNMKSAYAGHSGIAAAS